MPATREHPPLETRVMLALAWMASAAIIVVPLAVTPDLLDRFRVVKEALMRAQGILSLLLITIAAVFGSSSRLRELLRERAVVTTAAAGLLWTLITTLTSTHRLWSAESLVSCLTSILVAAGVCYAAPRIGLIIIDLLVIPVSINAVLSAAQEFGLYQPFVVDPLATRHLAATALVGNPNIIGTYMALAAVILSCAAVRVHGRRTWLYAGGATLATVSVFVSGTLTAMIALVIGMAVLALLISLKRSLAIAAAMLVLFGAGAFLNVPIVERLLRIPSRIATAGLEAATSGRVTPALAAAAMFQEHPVFGVGPGAFGFQYMRYQIVVRARYGPTVEGVGATMFSATHNDHLQMLAETGLPGYALFLSAIAAIVLCARRAVPEDDRGRVTQLMLPVVTATFLVLALAQFPLHVAITRHLLMTVAGLGVGWSRR